MNNQPQDQKRSLYTLLFPTLFFPNRSTPLQTINRTGLQTHSWIGKDLDQLQTQFLGQGENHRFRFAVEFGDVPCSEFAQAQDDTIDQNLRG